MVEFFGRSTEICNTAYCSNHNPPPNDVPPWYTKYNVNQTSLEDQASWPSMLFLSYVTPLVRLGGTKILDGNDVGVPNTCDRANVVYQRENDAINAMKVEKMPVGKREGAKPFVGKKPELVTAIVTVFEVSRLLLGLVFHACVGAAKFYPGSDFGRSGAVL